MSVVCTLFGERETTGMGGCEAGRYPLVGPILGLSILKSKSIIYFQQVAWSEVGGQSKRYKNDLPTFPHKYIKIIRLSSLGNLPVLLSKLTVILKYFHMYMLLWITKLF